MGSLDTGHAGGIPRLFLLGRFYLSNSGHLTAYFFMALVGGECVSEENFAQASIRAVEWNETGWDDMRGCLAVIDFLIALKTSSYSIMIIIPFYTAIIAIIHHE